MQLAKDDINALSDKLTALFLGADSSSSSSSPLIFLAPALARILYRNFFNLSNDA